MGPTVGRMTMKKMLMAAVATAVLTAPLTTGVADAATPRVKTYANCTALNKVYSHGVGLKGAHDHTSGTAVTNFARRPAVYRANKKSDRDKDGIACEKK
jgi:hypothetical protein